jgi:Tol biopolymer transport system component
MRKTAVAIWLAIACASSVSAQRPKYTVAYASSKGIFVMRDTTRQLTEDLFALVSERSWSPDATRLLFYTYRRTKADDILAGKYDVALHFPIYVMDADGSKQQRLLDFPVLPDATWSPDGKKILFTSAYREPPAIGVYIVDPAARTLIRLSDRGMWPSWSPDGSRVLFVSGVTVNVVDATGANLRSVARLPVRVASPVWSPDGKKIAFVSSGWWTMNPDGSELTRVSASPTTAVRFSPDGKRIVVTAQGGSYVANIDGTNVYPIRETRGRILDATFAPDGRRIIYRVHVGLQDVLTAVNIDGTDPQTIAENIGERIVFAVAPKMR